MKQNETAKDKNGQKKMHSQTNQTICEICDGTKFKTVEDYLGVIEIDCPKCNDQRIRNGFPHK